MLSDADDGDVAVLDAGLHKGLFVQRMDDDGMLRHFTHLSYFFFVFVQHQDFRIGFCQFTGQGGAETSEAHDSIRCLFCFLFSKHNQSSCLTDGDIAGRVAGAFAGCKVPERGDGQRPEASDIHDKDGQQLAAVRQRGRDSCG